MLKQGLTKIRTDKGLSGEDVLYMLDDHIPHSFVSRSTYLHLDRPLGTTWQQSNFRICIFWSLMVTEKLCVNVWAVWVWLPVLSLEELDWPWTQGTSCPAWCGWWRGRGSRWSCSPSARSGSGAWPRGSRGPDWRCASCQEQPDPREQECHCWDHWTSQPKVNQHWSWKLNTS